MKFERKNGSTYPQVTAPSVIYREGPSNSVSGLNTPRRNGGRATVTPSKRRGRRFASPSCSIVTTPLTRLNFTNCQSALFPKRASAPFSTFVFSVFLSRTAASRNRPSVPEAVYAISNGRPAVIRVCLLPVPRKGCTFRLPQLFACHYRNT